MGPQAFVGSAERIAYGATQQAAQEPISEFDTGVCHPSIPLLPNRKALPLLPEFLQRRLRVACHLNV